MSETHIDGDDFAAAMNDPRVHAFWREADVYAEKLIARGHCRCHLVVNCPDESRAMRARAEELGRYR